MVVADLGTGDFNMKLRVYKGTQQVTENTIIDLPTGVVTFHMDTTALCVKPLRNLEIKNLPK